MRVLPCALAVLAVAISVPRSAEAFCLSTTNLDFVMTEEQPCDTTGKPLFWPTSCIDLFVDRNASVQVSLATARRVLGISLDAWAAVTCDPGTCSGSAEGKPSLVGRAAGVSTCAFGYVSDGTNTNIVIFRDSGWTHDADVLALTTVSFKIESGEIIDADIEVNSDPSTNKLSTSATPPSDAYDLESILTHEAGHVFGIAHSDDPEATMRLRYETGDTALRTLATDDVCALCAAAPPGRDVPCDPKAGSCAVVEPEPGVDGGVPDAPVTGDAVVPPDTAPPLPVQPVGMEPPPGYTCACNTPGVVSGGGFLALLAIAAAFVRRRR